ncbi:hypothetical protein Tsp_16009 [Trichinella spiralis]|uniref:hypothetical protein n=1 Tax=Trichinella spiralis TaxID=6334 RepID=UPI0001EFD8FC|nr:hypothetical protein Tsp_16009 [Trichinella spiralis]
MVIFDNLIFQFGKPIQNKETVDLAINDRMTQMQNFEMTHHSGKWKNFSSVKQSEEENGQIHLGPLRKLPITNSAMRLSRGSKTTGRKKNAGDCPQRKSFIIWYEM